MHTPMTVIRKTAAGKNKRMIIDLNEVLYATKDCEGRLVFYSECDKYYAITLEDMEERKVKSIGNSS